MPNNTSSNNTIDPNSGTVTFSGSSFVTKGNHDHMPARNSSYLPTDERGHLQASSLGGTNNRDNVLPQAKDLNHGSWYNMEKAERGAIRSGCDIQSEKTAIVSNQPGGRPDAFTVHDTITFPSGNTQEVHLSFANLQTDHQTAVNEQVATETSDMMDAYANPGDGLRASMTAEEYAALMEETDALLPNISDHFTEWDFQGVPGTNTPTGMDAIADWDGGFCGTGTVSADTGTTADSGGANADGSGVSGSDDGAGPSGSDDDT